MLTAIAIADAVADELNAAPPGTFSPVFTAVRRVLPEYELSELAELKVTVVPKSVEITGATRAASKADWQIDIGIQKKLGTDLDTEVADLCDLSAQIIGYMRQRVLTASPGVAWVRTQNDPIYAPDHLAEQRAFTSVITATYRAVG